MLFGRRGDQPQDAGRARRLGSGGLPEGVSLANVDGDAASQVRQGEGADPVTAVTIGEDTEQLWIRCDRKLLALVQGHSILLEEYARAQIAAEEQHVAEIGKMMRRG